MEGSLPPGGFIILSKSDVRWIQRRQNYRTALSRLTAAVALANQRPLSKLEQQGVVQAFEFTHELASDLRKFGVNPQNQVRLQIALILGNFAEDCSGSNPDFGVEFRTVREANAKSSARELRVLELPLIDGLEGLIHPAFKFAAVAATGKEVDQDLG